MNYLNYLTIHPLTIDVLVKYLRKRINEPDFPTRADVMACESLVSLVKEGEQEDDSKR
jgi:hypothetical protein